MAQMNIGLAGVETPVHADQPALLVPLLEPGQRGRQVGRRRSPYVPDVVANGWSGLQAARELAGGVRPVRRLSLIRVRAATDDRDHAACGGEIGTGVRRRWIRSTASTRSSRWWRARDRCRCRAQLHVRPHRAGRRSSKSCARSCPASCAGRRAARGARQDHRRGQARGRPDHRRGRDRTRPAGVGERDHRLRRARGRPDHREARAEAQRLREEVDDYVDTALANFEQFLTRSLASIERGRDKMHALREIGSFQGEERRAAAAVLTAAGRVPAAVDG